MNRIKVGRVFTTMKTHAPSELTFMFNREPTKLHIDLYREGNVWVRVHIPYFSLNLYSTYENINMVKRSILESFDRMVWNLTFELFPSINPEGHKNRLAIYKKIISNNKFNIDCYLELSAKDLDGRPL